MERTTSSLCARSAVRSADSLSTTHLTVQKRQAPLHPPQIQTTRSWRSIGKAARISSALRSLNPAGQNAEIIRGIKYLESRCAFNNTIQSGQTRRHLSASFQYQSIANMESDVSCSYFDSRSFDHCVYMPSSTIYKIPCEMSATQTVRKVIDNLNIRLSQSRIFEPIRTITNGDAYIFGGAVRRSAYGSTGFGDLDIMAPNGDFSALNSLRRSSAQHTLNRQGHHRFLLGGEQIDYFQPGEFYHGFEDVEGAVRFFDFKISALAICIATGQIIDPFDTLSKVSCPDPGINWYRWDKMAPIELCVLAIRFAKIMHEFPQASISDNDATRLRLEVLPIISNENMTDFWSRFPLRRDKFLNHFLALLSTRTRLVCEMS